MTSKGPFQPKAFCDSFYDLVSGFLCCFSSGFPALGGSAAGTSASWFAVHLGTALWYQGLA